MRAEIENRVEEEDDDALYEALGEDHNDIDEEHFESILICKKEERVQRLMKRRLLSMLLSKTSDISQLDDGDDDDGKNGGGSGGNDRIIDADKNVGKVTTSALETSSSNQNKDSFSPETMNATCDSGREPSKTGNDIHDAKSQEEGSRSPSSVDGNHVKSSPNIVKELEKESISTNASDSAAGTTKMGDKEETLAQPEIEDVVDHQDSIIKRDAIADDRVVNDDKFATGFSKEIGVDSGDALKVEESSFPSGIKDDDLPDDLSTNKSINPPIPASSATTITTTKTTITNIVGNRKRGPSCSSGVAEGGVQDNDDDDDEQLEAKKTKTSDSSSPPPPLHSSSPPPLLSLHSCSPTPTTTDVLTQELGSTSALDYSTASLSAAAAEATEAAASSSSPNRGNAANVPSSIGLSASSISSFAVGRSVGRTDLADPTTSEIPCSCCPPLIRLSSNSAAAGTQSSFMTTTMATGSSCSSTACISGAEGRCLQSVV